MVRTALVVIDMQRGIFQGKKPTPQWPRIRERVGALISRAARAGVPVIYVQHDGPAGHRLEVGTEGWQLDPVLEVGRPDAVCHKTACDSFFQTPLQAELEKRAVKRLVVAGCMSDYCVDTTCRHAVSMGYDVVLAADAHATCDGGALTADQIIAHHNEALDGLDAGPTSVRVVPAAEVDLE